jgi:putative ABC transport system ATP-binding protein/lipoprotein-releasing system ATP-binding protein
MNEPLVVAKGLSKDYPLQGGGSVGVLRGIECRIDDGEHIAIAGPSGSGKSTLLHCLGGLVKPTRGELSWPALGARETLLPEKIQFVFQSPSLHPALNVIRNVSLPIVLAGRGGDPEARALEVLEAFGLDELSDKLPEELSGGQAQRVAMARALAIRPRLILADEPTGQLDSKTATAFLEQVLEMTRTAGAALVVATHDPLMARQMDQRWTLEHGALLVLQNGSVS